MDNSSQLTESLIRAFLYGVFAILGLFFLFIIRDILLMFYVAIILSLAFDGPIDWLQRHKVHRLLGAAFFYLLIFSITGLIFYWISVPLSSETKDFVSSFPVLLEKAEIYFGIFQQWQQGFDHISFQQILANLAENLTGKSSRIFGSIINILGGFASFIFILVISIYLNAREKGVKKFLLNLIPFEHHIYALNLIEQIQKKMGNWVWGTLIACFSVGLFIYLGLLALGVKYALVLGVLAGILNLIPYIGPVISTIPAVFLAAIQNPILVLWVIVLYLVANLILEDVLIRPLIMKKAMGIDPLLIIFAVLAGGKIAGIAGIILAIPSAAIIGILIQEYTKNKIKELGAEIEE